LKLENKRTSSFSTASSTDEQNSKNVKTRKKYNVIDEDVRKKIIKKLTIDNYNIKEVNKLIFYFEFVNCSQL
jgi:hypothetical protein